MSFVSSFNNGVIAGELSRWADAGLTAVFWMRDDDAVAATPQLDELAKLANSHDIEIGLAVIPGNLQPCLASYLNSGATPFRAMCHGWVHANHASPDAPAEFGSARPIGTMRLELSRARATIEDALGIASPVFVPPFGQIAPAVVQALPSLGFSGLSNQSPPSLRRLAKLAGTQSWMPGNVTKRLMWKPCLDVHLDPIDWRTQSARSSAQLGAHLLGELRVRRLGYLRSDTPIGLLGHHLVHDTAVWRVLGDLIGDLKRQPSVSFPRLAQLMTSLCVSSQLSQPSTSQVPVGKRG